MYLETAIDGGSVFGGGGFMPSQSTGFNNDSSFSPGGSTKRSSSQTSGLLPLTVKQLSMASQKPSDDNFYVDGHEVNNITLVGMVINKEEKVTDVSFILDDSTGRIEVKKWIDGQDMDELMELRKIKNDSYVRVHGHLRSFQGKRNVVAFSVRPIQDFNEVTFHFLECIFVHVSSVTTQGGTVASRTPASTGVYSGPTVSVVINNQGTRNTNSYHNYTTPAAMSSVGGSVDECQKRLQAIFEEPANLVSDMGLHVDEVSRRMVGYSKKQVQDGIEFLVNEGLIYSTIDDDHYKSASC